MDLIRGLTDSSCTACAYAQAHEVRHTILPYVADGTALARQLWLQEAKSYIKMLWHFQRR